ncbi:S-layer homology domain-containing protein [Paenibacillus sp. CC-CFT747]|nr:S-layer homology domain-containing protein [Paenibacillus sp. CC-CFT747]
MVSRAMKLAGVETVLTPEQQTPLMNTFKDNGNVSPWAREAASTNIHHHLIEGYDGRIFPLQNITRAETAVVIERLLQQAGLI